MDILENKVEMQEQLKFTNDFYKNESRTECLFDSVGSLDNLQKTIFGLLNDVQNQETQIRNSLNDIKQTLNNLEFAKPSYSNRIEELPGPSLRSNFNTASLPYRWWNRSMPSLPLLERHVCVSRSQESLNETFKICYFTPKKKKKSISKMSDYRNSGYCIWLPQNKTGEVYCFRV